VVGDFLAENYIAYISMLRYLRLLAKDVNQNFPELLFLKYFVDINGDFFEKYQGESGLLIIDDSVKGIKV